MLGKCFPIWTLNPSSNYNAEVGACNRTPSKLDTLSLGHTDGPRSRPFRKPECDSFVCHKQI